MLKFLSRHRYKIVIGLVLLLIPIVLLNRMQDKVRTEAQKVIEIAEIFKADRNLTGVNLEKMTQFHLQGSGLATGLLMVVAERRGDLTGRDHLFFEGVKVGTNNALYSLMSSNTFLFSDKVRLENKQALDSETSDNLRRDLEKQQTSTLPAEDQQGLQVCFDRLKGRYQGFWSKAFEVTDFLFDTRSCDFSNVVQLTAKE